MKKYILLIPVVLVMAACSKKNEPTPTPLTPANVTAADLVGKWDVTADTLLSSTSSQFTVNQVASGTYFQFNADGTFTLGATASGTQGTANYTVKNGILTLISTVNNTSNDDILTIYTITKNSLGLRHINTNNTYEDAWFTKQ